MKERIEDKRRKALEIRKRKKEEKERLAANSENGLLSALQEDYDGGCVSSEAETKQEVKRRRVATSW